MDSGTLDKFSEARTKRGTTRPEPAKQADVIVSHTPSACHWQAPEYLLASGTDATFAKSSQRQAFLVGVAKSRVDTKVVYRLETHARVGPAMRYGRKATSP